MRWLAVWWSANPPGNSRRSSSDCKSISIAGQKRLVRFVFSAPGVQKSGFVISIQLWLVSTSAEPPACREMFRAALCKAAIRADARRLLGTAALETSGPTVVGVRVNGEYIPSDIVIVAAGAWSSELCRPLGIGLAVEPQRGQIVHLRGPETDTGTLPIILPALRDYYLLGFPDSRIVIGATRET